MAANCIGDASTDVTCPTTFTYFGRGSIYLQKHAIRAQMTHLSLTLRTVIKSAIVALLSFTWHRPENADSCPNWHASKGKKKLAYRLIRTRMSLIPSSSTGTRRQPQDRTPPPRHLWATAVTKWWIRLHMKFNLSGIKLNYSNIQIEILNQLKLKYFSQLSCNSKFDAI
jgi:hypothetical protein